MTHASLSPPIQTRSLRQHLGYLDSLRGIAILLVLWVHAGLEEGAASTAHWNMFFIGQRGVELFYEVSAFTLFLSLTQGRPEHAPLRNFYLRRFFRIAPAFYVAVLVDFIWVGCHQPDRWRYLLAILFLNGWSARAINLPIVGTWSVAVEAMFYLLVPVLFRRIRNVRSALLFFLAAWAVTYPVSRVFLHFDMKAWEYFMLRWPVVQLPVFALGILAFRIYQVFVDRRQTHPGFWSKGVRKGSSAALLLITAVLFFSNLGRGNNYLVPGSLCFVTLLLAGDLYAWPLLFNRPLAWIGKISFSLYLFHFFFLPLVGWMFALPRFAALPHGGAAVSICAFVVIGCVSIPLSWLTWRWIEIPGIALGRNLINRLEGRPGVRSLPPTEPGISTPDLQF